jgi:hypothetical protein
MGWRDILASLTSNPAAYFKATTKGRGPPVIGATVQLAVSGTFFELLYSGDGNLWSADAPG